MAAATAIAARTVDLSCKNCIPHGILRDTGLQARPLGFRVAPVLADADVDDLQAQSIARDIAKQVEEELTYPGQIRVTVVRESRVTELAR